MVIKSNNNSAQQSAQIQQQHFAIVGSHSMLCIQNQDEVTPTSQLLVDNIAKNFETTPQSHMILVAMTHNCHLLML